MVLTLNSLSKNLNKMKNIFTKFASVLAILALVYACDTDYINDPDNPEVAPSSQLFNNAQFDLAYELNDQWTAGRGTLGFAQYWAQAFYTNENRYALRTNMVNDYWNWPYRVLTDLKKVIDLNENPETKVLMSAYGDNNNQVQSSRILMSFTFSKLVDFFGDVPYWSYGNKDNADFQGLKLEEGVNAPAYTDAKVIYEDILKELLDAANKINTSANVSAADNIYGGDPSKWVKFAHSIRLRLASHLMKVDPALANKVFNESESKAFMGNDDSASLTFGGDDITGGPWHQAFTVGARRDFGPALPFVELLYNEKGPFTSAGTKDPRIDSYFDTRLGTEKVVGLPYGFGNATARAIKDEGIPSADIRKPNFTQPLLEYAEVAFIRSEFNNWDQDEYEKGVKASMERWGISQGDIDTYVGLLPAASEENVLTQKYIALYMDGLEGWTEYRRSGYPKTLTQPGDTYGDATFSPADGSTTIISRIAYPNNEQLLNNKNWDAARKKINGGDKQSSKIFWDIVD